MARLMQQYITWSDFHFHPKCAHLRIAHLAYADDLLLLARGDIPSVTTLIHVRHNLVRWSPQNKLNKIQHIHGGSRSRASIHR